MIVCILPMIQTIKHVCRTIRSPNGQVFIYSADFKYVKCDKGQKEYNHDVEMISKT